MSIATYRHGALLPPSVDFDVLAGSQLKHAHTFYYLYFNFGVINCGFTLN